jgi:hypothetical protein
MSLILDGTNGLSDVDGTAATPAIRGTDTNTGIFFPAADTIAFSEGGVEQMRLNSAGDLQMNSGYGSVATAYGCRAWVNFNGTGTVAIRASGNVSSITDNGTGDYTVNFTTALVDANYSASLTTTGFSGTNSDQQFLVYGGDGGATTKTSTALRVLAGRVTSAAPVDKAELSVTVFR